MKILASFPPRLKVWLFLGQPAITLCVLAIYTLGIFTLEELEWPISPFSFIGLTITFTLVGMIAASMGQFLSWAVSLVVAMISLQRWGQVRLSLFLAMTPFLGILLWYGYDQFVPGAEWAGSPPSAYVHGLTLVRFGIAWLVEIANVCIYWYPLRKSDEHRKLLPWLTISRRSGEVRMVSTSSDQYFRRDRFNFCPLLIIS